MSYVISFVVTHGGGDFLDPFVLADGDDRLGVISWDSNSIGKRFPLFS